MSSSSLAPETFPRRALTARVSPSMRFIYTSPNLEPPRPHNSPTKTALDKAKAALAKGDYFTAFKEVAAAEKAAGAPKADIALTFGQIHALVKNVEEAEKYLYQALELARKERNSAAERGASFSLGNLYITAKHPPEWSEALKPLERAWELHVNGKGKKDQLEHMNVGNAYGKCLRRLRRYEEAADIFLEVSKLQSSKAETKYEFTRWAMWKDDRPATEVSESRVWSGVGFYETRAAQHKVKPAKPQGLQVLYRSLRSESPDVFKFSSWSDPADNRPSTADAARTRAMKRFEDDTKKEFANRTATRKASGLPPIEAPRSRLS